MNNAISDESHISIAMPDGSTCRAYFPFQVYSTDDGSGEIVRFSWEGVNKLTDAIEAHLKRDGVRSIESPHLPELVETREILTDLPHSPARTAMRSIDTPISPKPSNVH
jgi:hypothetical protein